MCEERPVEYDEAKNEISKVHVFPRPLNILTEECFFAHFVVFPKENYFLPDYIQDIGAGKGKYYAVNFPLRDGIDDDAYMRIFKPASFI